jgi:hypothetical protein
MIIVEKKTNATMIYHKLILLPSILMLCPDELERERWIR